MRHRTETEGDDALVAESLARLARVPLPPPATDAAALLRRFRFLQRAQERGRAQAAVQRPLAVGYGLAAALLVGLAALPQLAGAPALNDASTLAVVGSVTRLVVWPVALLGAALLLAVGVLSADA
jgi:hypothetical protein